MHLCSMEQTFFPLAVGLHSLRVVLLPATSLVDLLSVVFPAVVVPTALQLTGDLTSQPKKEINWQVSIRFTGLATYSYHQSHLSLQVSDMAYWDSESPRRHPCMNRKRWPKLGLCSESETSAR